MDYPSHLHDAHNCYPLAVERVQLTEDMLSPTAKAINKKLCRKYTKSTKLVPNLNDKRKYVIHYRNLKFYLKHGLKLVRIHQAIRFRQIKWLAPYIDKNTTLRSAATCRFQKDFFKLLNNSMYGKTMENLRRRTDVQIVSRVVQAERLLSKYNCRAWRQINEHFSMVQLDKREIFWNKPTIVGFCVLELSKLHMYHFHYEVMKPKYQSNLKLLFTDTNSMCYEITTENVYRDMQSMKQHFDTSDYPTNHALYSNVNSKVIGKFKDECNGVPVSQFVGLRPKMYSLKLCNNKEKSTAKGVGRVAQKDIRHEHYVQCLRDCVQTSASYEVVRSREHVLATETVNKIALSPFDDKRYLLPATHDTLAHGHYKILELENEKIARVARQQAQKQIWLERRSK